MLKTFVWHLKGRSKKNTCRQKKRKKTIAKKMLPPLRPHLQCKIPVSRCGRLEPDHWTPVDPYEFLFGGGEGLGTSEILGFTKHEPFAFKKKTKSCVFFPWDLFGVMNFPFLHVIKKIIQRPKEFSRLWRPISTSGLSISETSL